MKTKNIFRMLLVAAALLMGANNVKAIETTVWEGKTDYYSGDLQLSYSDFTKKGLSVGQNLRVYASDFANSWSININSGWSNSLGFNNWKGQSDGKTINNTNTNAFDTNGYFEMTIGDGFEKIEKENGFRLQASGVYITKITLYSGGGGSSSKTTPILSFGEGAQETYNITFGDSFTGPTATCDVSDLEITYESDNRSVADVATYTGEITIYGAGQALITAKTQASDDYNAASASYTINVAKVNYTLSYSASTATAVLGQSWTAPTLNNPSGISVTYSSTNTGVATIDQNGNVTLVAAGETTIKANYTGDNNHEAKEASYVLTVSTASAPAKQDVTLTFSPTSATATMGEAFNAPTLTATANGETVTGLSISYSSSNTSVATVNASTGAVTLVAPGTTTITASFSGNDNYNAATASYTLTVNAAAEYIPVDDNNIGENGYRTYVTPQAVDLSRSVNVEAYYATGLNSAGTEVEFTQVTGVCASGVPLLLKATVTGASEYKLLKSSAAGATPTGNKLVGGARDNISGANKYVLTSHNGSVVFAEVNIEGATVDTEHAYLDLSGSNARGRLSIRLNGESTGISTIENDERTLDGAIYNLRGQRVENPTKGLYIINGKKVVIK